MPEMTAHPSQEQLSAYNLGQLPPEETVAIESHISKCEPCCDTIISLSSDDTFVDLLKEARQLPTDQTVDHDAATASSSCQDVPDQLAEHPRYEILGPIGKGGMGDVYKARHRKMERTVALKVINRELIRKAEAVDRFHREVKAAAQLSHPNIVTAHDADQAGDFHFMVMEYVDGVDLSQTVKDRGALPVAEACDYIRQAAIGLQHAHECGMVHRDIKPHNLMVTSDGTVKILDFGLASLAPEAIADTDTVEARGDLTAAGAIMGTPDFISPEQADDARKADIRSDIYSLGATLYFLLAGRPPFAEGSVTQKLKSHAQAEPEPLKTLREDVPPELAAVVTKMTAKDPEGRFQTPAEVAEALKSFSRSIEPRKGVEPPPQAKPRRWKPTFLSFTAVAALFVAAIVAGVIYYVQTDHGVIRVEVTDPSLEVSINHHTMTMKDGDGQELKIRPGNQTLVVRRDDADFEFETDRFQIRRGDEVAFEVEMLQGEIVVRKDGKPFDQEKLPESALGSNDSLNRTAQKRDADADTRKAGHQRSDNQLQMPLCWCPAGEFKMGREQLPVTLTRGFWMGKYEVTQAQYEAVMGDNPSDYKGESVPVEGVKWNEAKKFCQKFTELERKAGRLPEGGWEYRLPTEAQWEYACRAGTTLVWDEEKDFVYPSTFGDDLSELGDYAWYNENSDGKTHPVGQKKPNAWGLCDMHGNVFEWVRDAWQSKLSGGEDPEADIWSPVQTLRGGDFFLPAEACGSPFLRGIGVGEQASLNGFRVALVMVDESGAESAKEKPAGISRQQQIDSEGE